MMFNPDRLYAYMRQMGPAFLKKDSARKLWDALSQIHRSRVVSPMTLKPARLLIALTVAPYGAGNINLIIYKRCSYYLLGAIIVL
jgi:hypothetical protein